ncbi:Myelin basic protein [Anabarilius grahami]|uniref:Myelin basic protein n=1 Tax=Anabarilius grahami TaxID=495550 RepID=A0A3N0YIB5_ANAGA|nr:Myelin basic protein [Anabarilius grahami]
MATASTSGQSPFGLSRKKRAPGLLDQIGRFFRGDKKRKGKGSFRGHLSSSPQRPQHSSTRRRGDVNPVVHFFRSFSDSLLLDDFETARLFLSRSRLHRQRVARRALDRLTDAEGNRIHSPESSTWEKADLALHPNAGAPSSEPFADQKNTKMEESETEEKQKIEREDLCLIDSQVAASLTD